LQDFEIPALRSTYSLSEELLSEGFDSFLLDAATQAILANRLGNYVDGSLQYFGQPPIERIKPAEISETFTPGLVGHAYDDIDVGIGLLFASRGRAKERKAAHSGSAKLRLMCA
jgi:hypothetical protein